MIRSTVFVASRWRALLALLLLVVAAPVDEAGSATGDPTWTARVLDGAGEPLAGAVIQGFETRRWHGGVELIPYRLSTGADGVLEVPAGAPPATYTGRALELRLIGDSRQTLASATLALPLQYTDERRDLGEVRLAELPLLVAGRVLDERGVPVEGAHVGLYATRPDMAERQVAALQGEPGVALGGRTSGSTYGGPTGPDGRFDVRGAPPEKPGWLVVSKGGYYPIETDAYPPPAAGLELTMHRAGAARGELAGLSDSTLSVMSVELVATEIGAFGAGEEPLRAFARVESGGSFELRLVPSGIADLLVYAPGDLEPVWRVESVEIMPVLEGGVTDLGTLDLTGHVRTLRITAVDESGALIRGASVRYCAHERPDWPASGRVEEPEGDPGAPPGVREEVERVLVTRDGRSIPVQTPTDGVVAAHPVDVLVQAPGYLQERLEGVTEDRRVVLRPAIEVALQLPDGFLLPSAPLTLQASLDPAARATSAAHFFAVQRSAGAHTRRSDPPEQSSTQLLDGMVESVQGSFDGSPMLSLGVSAPGVYTVGLRVRSTSMSRGIRLATGSALVVKEGEEVIFHEVAPDPDQYANALTAVGG